MKKIFTTMFALATLATMGTTANADQLTNKIYMEIDYLRLDMTWNNYAGVGLDFSAKPPALGIKLGAQINDYFAVEGLLGIGIGKDNFVDIGGISLDGELNSLISANVLAVYPATENLKIYGKLGVAKMDLKITANAFGVSDSRSFDDTGALYGAGLAFDFSKNSTLTLEYIVLPDVSISESGEDLGKVETTSINIGYKYSF